jgi:hypothetical protein
VKKLWQCMQLKFGEFEVLELIVAYGITVLNPPHPSTETADLKSWINVCQETSSAIVLTAF